VFIPFRKEAEVSEAERYKSALFDIVRLRFERRLSELELRYSNVSLDSRADMILRHLVVGLNAWAAAGQQVEEKKGHVTVAVPASWWQHFKLACLPTWVLRRCPARMEIKRIETLAITARNVCPHLAVDPERRHVEFLLAAPEPPRA
jgi:hypothetical protein